MAKKLVLFAIMVLTVAVFGCEKSSNRDDNDLVGTWHVYKVIAEGTDGNAMHTTVDSFPTGAFRFNDDGSGDADVWFQNYNTFPIGYVHTFTYNRTGNQLELTISGGAVDIWEIFEESANTLAIKWTQPPSGSVTGQIKYYMKK